jgi:hypothetical protein
MLSHIIDVDVLFTGVLIGTGVVERNEFIGVVTRGTDLATTTMSCVSNAVSIVLELYDVRSDSTLFGSTRSDVVTSS